MLKNLKEHRYILGNKNLEAAADIYLLCSNH